MSELRPGDITKIEGSLCLVFRDKETKELRNIILTNTDEPGKLGVLSGEELYEYAPLFNLAELLEKVT